VVLRCALRLCDCTLDAAAEIFLRNTEGNSQSPVSCKFG
jgi:hypothetical protein